MGYVFIVESSIEHMVSGAVTCIEGVFSTEQAARCWLSKEGLVEVEDWAIEKNDDICCVVSGPFYDPAFDFNEYGDNLIILRCKVRD